MRTDVPCGCWKVSEVDETVASANALALLRQRVKDLTTRVETLERLCRIQAPAPRVLPPYGEGFKQTDVRLY